MTSRIWLRCVHGVSIRLFLPLIQQKHLLSFGRAGQFMMFTTVIHLTLFIEPDINCSSCDGVESVLTSLYNITRRYASSSVFFCSTDSTSPFFVAESDCQKNRPDRDSVGNLMMMGQSLCEMLEISSEMSGKCILWLHCQKFVSEASTRGITKPDNYFPPQVMFEAVVNPETISILGNYNFDSTGPLVFKKYSFSKEEMEIYKDIVYSPLGKMVLMALEQHKDELGSKIISSIEITKDLFAGVFGCNIAFHIANDYLSGAGKMRRADV